MDPKEVLNEAETRLRDSKENFDSTNYYASFFYCLQSVENSLKYIYIKKYKKEPKTKDAAHLLRLIDPPQNIKYLCNKVLHPYHPNRYHTSTTAGELLEAAKEIFSYAKSL